MEIQVRKLKESDLKAVVDVHMKAFPDFFLTFLGPRFLRVFYASFIYDGQGKAFVAVNSEKKIIGVIAGPISPQGYFKRLLKKKWYAFCLASIGAVLKKPKVIPRLFRAVFYRGQTPPGPERSLLSSIAVLPGQQGTGIGKKLVFYWVEEMKKNNSNGCYLTTDAENNENVNNFYNKIGWNLESVYTTKEGRKMNRYVFDFKDSNNE